MSKNNSINIWTINFKYYCNKIVTLSFFFKSDYFKSVKINDKQLISGMERTAKSDFQRRNWIIPFYGIFNCCFELFYHHRCDHVLLENWNFMNDKDTDSKCKLKDEKSISHHLIFENLLWQHLSAKFWNTYGWFYGKFMANYLFI